MRGTARFHDMKPAFHIATFAAKNGVTIRCFQPVKMTSLCWQAVFPEKCPAKCTENFQKTGNHKVAVVKLQHACRRQIVAAASVQFLCSFGTACIYLSRRLRRDWRKICLKSARKCLNCGFQHGDPAVVGRKSGAPEIINDDICIITSLLKEATRPILPAIAPVHSDSIATVPAIPRIPATHATVQPIKNHRQFSLTVVFIFRSLKILAAGVACRI